MSPSAGPPSIAAISLLKIQGCPPRTRRSWFLRRTMRAGRAATSRSAPERADAALGRGPSARRRATREREADEAVDETRGEEVGGDLTGDRRQLDHVEPDDVRTLRHRAEQVDGFVPVESARLGRAGAGNDRRIEAVHVEGDIDVVGERREDGVQRPAEAAEPAHAPDRRRVLLEIP